MLKPIEGRSKRYRRHDIQRRICNLTEKFDGDTQNLRSQLIFELKSLQEMAIEQIQSDKCKKGPKHQDWARLATYISQVINSITKTYDIAQIKDELEQLRRTVGDLPKA